MNSDKGMIYLFHHYAEVPAYGTCLRHWSLMRYLMDNGYRVKVFASSFVHSINKNMVNDNYSDIYKEEEVDSVPFVYIRTRSYVSTKDRVLNMVDYYVNLKKSLDNFEKPDLIIATMPHPLACLAGVQISKKYGVPFICEILDLWPESIVTYGNYSEYNPVILALYRLEKWIYEKADGLVFSWEGAYDYIVNKGWSKSISRDKFRYINIGVDLDEFNRDLREYRLEDDRDLNSDAFKVMYCGAIRPANDIEILVHCARILKEKEYGRDIKFIIYGDGPDKNRLETIVKEHGLDNVIFKGFINKRYIPYVLSKSNVNILNLKPSTTQQYGNSSNKLFEYFASGNPVIANIREGKYPIISKYNCGVVVEPNSLDEYVHAIISMYDMYKNAPTEFKKYQTNARKTAQIFDMKNMNENFEKVITQLIEENTANV